MSWKRRTPIAMPGTMLASKARSTITMVATGTSEP